MLISSDAAFICIMMVFAFTDAYMKNICFMFGPKSMSNPADQVLSHKCRPLIEHFKFDF